MVIALGSKRGLVGIFQVEGELLRISPVEVKSDIKLMSTLELGSAVVGLVIFHKQVDTAQREWTCQCMHFSTVEDPLSRRTL